MTVWLCQIDAVARATAAATTIRFASHDDHRLCHLNGNVWWPAIARLPTLSYDFFDGAFGGDIVAPSGRADLSLGAVPGFAALMLHGARIRWWSGAAGAAWGDFVLRFDGMVENQAAVRDGVASIEFRVDDRWLDDPILSTYAGTTGAEGEAALKGQVKPLALGKPKMAEGVLVNSVSTIIQVSDGPFAAIDVAFEDAARFAAPVADYASYAALDAATIAPAFLATAKAVGLVRHGAPPAGVLTYDISGSNSGADGGGLVQRTGAIIRRIATKIGQGVKVDAAALAAIDVARPWNVSLYLDQQTTMRELAKSMAQAINAVALVTWTGLLTILPIGRPEDATPVGTLASDGSKLPPVARVDQLGIASPFWRLAIEAEITNRVHGNDEIRFTAQLIDRGRYNPAESYREGHIVDLADGSRWLYVAVTPTTGNAPPTWPTTSDAFWSMLTPPSDRGKIFVRSTPPTAAESTGGDIWQDDNGRYWIRRDDNHLSIGGNRLMIAGNLLTITWTPTPTQPVRAGIDAALAIALAATDAAAALALDAQATADGKVRSFYLTSAPTAEGVGDLWFDTDDGNKQYRWSGSAWVAVQDTKIGDALTAAAGAQATADGKVTTFIGESAPTAEGVGDMWFKQSTGELRRWDGTVWGDPLVDLTAAAIPRHEPTSATLSFTADSGGTIAPASQLPETLLISRFLGTTDVSEDAGTTWAVDYTEGLTGGTPTVEDGLVTLPIGLVISPDGALIRVKSSRSGFDIYTNVTLTTTNAPPSSGGSSGGGAASDSTLADVPSTTSIKISDTMTVKSGTGGKIDFAGILSITCPKVLPTGSYGAQAQWKYKLSSGGSLTNAGAAIDDTTPCVIDELFDPYRVTRSPGQINVARSLTGLTASTNYDVELWMKADVSGPTLSFGGTVTATGS